MPENTSAQYGDWTLLCQASQPGQRVCQVAVPVRDSRQQVVALVAFLRVARDQPPRFVTQVSGAVRVSQPLRLVLDSETPLPFGHCTRQACVVELELRDDVLARRFRSQPAEQPGRLLWHDAVGSEQAHSLTVRGFGAAWDALTREGF